MFLHVSVCPRGVSSLVHAGMHTPGTRGRHSPPPWAVYAGRYRPQAAGTHPIGMHSCLSNYFCCLWAILIWLWRCSPRDYSSLRERFIHLSFVSNKNTLYVSTIFTCNITKNQLYFHACDMKFVTQWSEMKKSLQMLIFQLFRITNRTFCRKSLWLHCMHNKMLQNI